MEDQNLEQPKGKKIKFIIWFVILLFGVITAVNLSLFGWYKLTQYLNTKKVQQLAEELQKQQEDQYQKVISDTYGGKTPQETLKMYIDAVEKGDYELASKYFIESKQEKEKQSLLNSKKEDIENIIEILKRVRPRTKEEIDKILKSNYEYFIKDNNSNISYEEYLKRIPSENPNEFTMITYINGYTFSVDFIKYPNNIWKIVNF